MSFPIPPQSAEPTSFSEIDKALGRLEQSKDAWLKVSTEKRATLLKECMTDLLVLGEEWVAKSCLAKGLVKGENEEGEEWISNYMPVVRNIRLLIHAMKANGQPKIPKISTRPDGQLVATVFPDGLLDKLMLAETRAEIWIQKGKKSTQGIVYREPQDKGKVSLVLGAGNQHTIACMDLLYKLFVENEVVILKMNPVNDYIGQYIIRAFRALIEGNYLSVVFGGIEEGKYLCSHEKVNTIHITGAAKTHDAIVWGTEKNKTTGTKINKRPITSELGCVTPVMVVPGKWSDKDIDFQARQIVSMVTQNASFNCNAGKVVVLPKSWNQTAQLTDRIKHHFQQKETRKAFYPGAKERHQAFLHQYPEALQFGDVKEDTLPWTLLPDVPAEEAEYALQNEAFCSILAITHLESESTPDYMEKMVKFCNQKVWGSLSTNVLIHPSTQKEFATEFDQVIANLEYGTIAINCWNGLGYGLVSPTWGAFPKHTLEDIQSGIGVVHNSFLLDYPEKSVIYSPFIIKPTPAWFYDHKNLRALGKALVHFEVKPSLLRLVSILPKAMKG